MPGFARLALGRGQRALRASDAALRRRHGRGLLIGGGAACLPWRSETAPDCGQLRVGVLIEQGQIVGACCWARSACGSGQIGFRLRARARPRRAWLAPSAIGSAATAAAERRSDLAPIWLCASAAASAARAAVLARANLRVIENRDDVAGLHAVAFAHAHFENASGGLRRDGGIVAFDRPLRVTMLSGTGDAAKNTFHKRLRLPRATPTR